MGIQTFFKSANRKSAISWAHSATANLSCANPQTANPPTFGTVVCKNWIFILFQNFVIKFPYSVELHDVSGLALQPELIKLYEEVAENKNKLI